ncbi:hypothetical protein BaRGS_00024581, partial [Batillaria attramentaria]
MQEQFPVRAHTRNVDKCLLHKYTSKTHGFRDGTFILGSCTGTSSSQPLEITR